MKICSLCKRSFSDKELEDKKRKKSENIKKGLAKAKNVGRPRIADYSKIIELRKSGLSIRVISRKLNISNGVVQRAIQLELK